MGLGVGGNGSTDRIYSCHFAGYTHFYFIKAGKRKMGLGGWGLTGTPIDMSSFYLLNEFFFLRS